MSIVSHNLKNNDSDIIMQEPGKLDLKRDTKQISECYTIYIIANKY